MLHHAPSTLEELLDIEAIKQLKARYCLLVDSQEWDTLRELFLDDARIVDAGSERGTFTDPDAWLEEASARMAGDAHFHSAHMPILEITGADSARGFWSFNNRGGTLGHYQDEYRRVGGVWKFAAMEVTFIIPPPEELKRRRKGAFERGRWRSLVAAWAAPPAPVRAAE